MSARNNPYSGGYVTQHYGRPTEGIHVLQIEINRLDLHGRAEPRTAAAVPGDQAAAGTPDRHAGARGAGIDPPPLTCRWACRSTSLAKPRAIGRDRHSPCFGRRSRDLVRDLCRARPPWRRELRGSAAGPGRVRTALAAHRRTRSAYLVACDAGGVLGYAYCRTLSPAQCLSLHRRRFDLSRSQGDRPRHRAQIAGLRSSRVRRPPASGRCWR